jgi:hypothetical protein
MKLSAAWELWPLALRAAGLLGEHTLAPSSLQPTDLEGWVLVKRGNGGIAYQHAVSYHFSKLIQRTGEGEAYYER